MAGYDVAHKLALAGVWELPFLKDSTGWQKAVLAGWQLAGSAIFQTGTPTQRHPRRRVPDWRLQRRRRRRRSPERAGPEHQAERLEPGRVPERHLPGHRLPAAGAPGQNGNLPRNAYRGPGYADVSLSFSKKFDVSQTTSAEFRIDAFNAFNRVNLSDPNMDLSSTNFGKSTSQLNTRAIQIGLRLRF